MKVFLSWSGELSHSVACILRDWLPSVIQAVKPYVSSEDIDKGARWSSDIAQELENSSYGIICVTPENVAAPWVNFEAGALSKTIETSFVTPFLFRIKRSDVVGPLVQFQSTIYEKNDVERLLLSMNLRLQENERLSEAQLHKAFSVWWPELVTQLDALPEHQAEQMTSTGDKSEQILEELLELVRGQQRLLRSPEDLLPREYLSQAVRGPGSPAGSREALKAAYDLSEHVREMIDLAATDHPEDITIQQIARWHAHLVDDLRKLAGPRQRRLSKEDRVRSWIEANVSKGIPAPEAP